MDKVAGLTLTLPALRDIAWGGAVAQSPIEHAGKRTVKEEAAILQ